ncbi:hypothetical protein CHGG_08695 [Chaetomium globosum CBS 148.51]|uniref:General negative regulator of transcription subunit n=1 Tax=Chaetomium globosum (strain ATCC 6205 / CBS 148.51 / DSM 1962 / NBRC 6347 / NRRL 1970) TaxID=306901 RepID=Q2GTK9_CHAGB|nr:uncharacterized protein CHGG_08695 [Chaetomium globosum CBS 148.51]EAQ84681.1 hypothetical protein CHGG_08695 [Chaetomium globosum CBS 148.51]
MAARKLQQEVDKCFKKVAEGVTEFESIYEKIEQSTNQAQKEKLEDQLKREIKKLQRLRDQIKTWAASNDIKDKAPLLEQRRLIETQMERFKAVEKAMKTKAYSKEGLSAAAKLDPREQAKLDAGEFLGNMVDELEQQIETLEAECESIQATMKKGKGHAAKAERIAEIERIIERHKWHQGKLELIRRSLENGGVETEQVNELGENIKYYVSDGMNDDFMEDETMYDDLNLEDEEDQYGMNQDNDRVSLTRHPVDTGRCDDGSRDQTKRALREAANGGRCSSRDSHSAAVYATQIPTPNARDGSPQHTTAYPQQRILDQCWYEACDSAAKARGRGLEVCECCGSSCKQRRNCAVTPTALGNTQPRRRTITSTGEGECGQLSECCIDTAAAQTNGAANGIRPIEEAEEEEESIYHLPASLQDLVESFEVTKKRPASMNSPATHRMQAASEANKPGVLDAEPPRNYQPDVKFHSHSRYPQEPLSIFDDPRLYTKIDPDTLFYVFYYKQGTYQQYLAARALKDQSWRFHKQYQTWFQRHEEPKSITEEFEQGTYRFFDYESTCGPVGTRVARQHAIKFLWVDPTYIRVRIQPPEPIAKPLLFVLHEDFNKWVATDRFWGNTIKSKCEHHPPRYTVEPSSMPCRSERRLRPAR